MTLAGRKRAQAVPLLAVVALLGLAGCGDDGEPSATDGTANTGSTPATTAGVECPGEPLRFKIIASLTGPLAFAAPARDYEQSVEAALAAINGSCTAGRPLEVEVCDDRSDPNQSTACGREAAGDGTLALFGSVGYFDAGADASGLPAVLTHAATAFDVLNERSFPATSVLTLTMANVSASAGAGARSALFVAADSAQAQSAIPTLTPLADELGVSLDFLLYPPDTTDFTAVAAQIVDRGADAIYIAVPSVVPFLNALAGEGITGEDTLLLSSVDVITTDAIAELGDVAEGLYLVTESTPPQDADNLGVQQMLDEYEAAGIDTDPDDMTTVATRTWSKLHVLAETIGELEPAVRDELDAQDLVNALIARGRIDRPELAGFDLSQPAFPDIEALAPFRVFDDEAMLVRVEDGRYRTVSDFTDVRQSFEIDLDD